MEIATIFIGFEEELFNFFDELSFGPIEYPKKHNGWSFVFDKNKEEIVRRVAQKFPGINVAFC